ncbi:hypothetical protein ACQ4PT_065239 [Festuca glaucescens]
MSETRKAVRYAKSAKDSADRQEIALLETRRDVADLSVFLTNKSTQSEPTTQDYLAALRLGPDAGSAIKWPIRSMKEFKVAVLAALGARGVSVDELVALGLLNAPYYPRYPPPKSSGKRKAPDAPTQAPSYAEDLARKANKLASLLVDGVTNNRALDRCWVELLGQPVVHLTGLELKLIVAGLTDINEPFCDAASRVMNRVEAVKFASGLTEAPRFFWPVTFVRRVLANIQSNVNLVDMIANSSIEFNVRDCLEFVAAVPVGDGWACYAWGFNSRNFTLIDPSANGMSVEDVKNKHRHAYEPLFAKLLMHASPSVRDAAWTEVIHTTVGVNCPRTSTGVFSVLAAKIVDCKTGQIALDHFDMAQCTKNMVYTVVNLDDNQMKVATVSSIYEATQMPVPHSLVRK